MKTVHNKRAIRISLLASLLLILILGCHLIAGPLYYRAPTITATVIDEESRQTISGAVVVARWVLDWWPGLTFEKPFYLVETVTRSDGSFTIRGWGPKLRPPFYVLAYRDPEIWIFKPGYYLGGGDNHSAYVPVITTRSGGTETQQHLPLNPGQRPERFVGDYSNAVTRFCYWNGKVMPLEPARRIERYVYDLDSLGLLDESKQPLPLMSEVCQAALRQLPPEYQSRVSCPHAIPVKEGL